MNSIWHIIFKISFLKEIKNKLSAIIVLIGRVSICLGICISILTISIGNGIQKSIKYRLADFYGHLVVKKLNVNKLGYFQNSVFKNNSVNLNYLNNNKIAHIQQYALLSGIAYNQINFEGLIFKGISFDFDSLRFRKFLIEGKFPIYKNKLISNEVVISYKLSHSLHLKLNDHFSMSFFIKNRKIIYKKFIVRGIFKTDIKNIDDNYLIGDIQQIRKINNWKNNQINGYEIFLKNIKDLDKIVLKLSSVFRFENFIEKSSDNYKPILEWINLFDINVYLLIFLMLIVVIINMIMILFVSIIERISFIAIMKSLGMNNFQLQVIFISHTFFVLIPGLVVGNLFAFILLKLQKIFNFIKLNSENYFFESIPVHIDPLYFFCISGILLIISLIILILFSYIIIKFNPSRIFRFD